MILGWLIACLGGTDVNGRLNPGVSRFRVGKTGNGREFRHGFQFAETNK